MYNTDVVLLHKQLKSVLEHHTLTGNGLCPEHQQLFDDGYIALIECDVSKSEVHGSKIDPSEAYRTGNIVHVKRDIADKLFSVSFPSNIPIAFVEQGVIEKLPKVGDVI